jgi:uncharacterized protein (DUF1015 family)
VADIRPFRGLRYDTDRVALADAVCPPYDVITSTMADALRRRSPYNAIHVELPLPPASTAEGRYAAAAELLRAWGDEGVLCADDEPTLYLVEQRFTGPDGLERTRAGFVCRLRLEDFAARVVLPHEKTHAGPKVDRLELLRATHTNEVGRALAAAAPPPAPALEALDGDGNPCSLRPVTGPAVDRVVALLADKQVLIADGHHRYETALAFRDERRAAGDDSADWVMVCLSNMNDPGLAIFATHRLLKNVVVPPVDEVIDRLRPAFTVTEGGSCTPRDCAPAMEHISRSGDTGKTLGLYFPQQRRCLTLELRDDWSADALNARGLSSAQARLSVNLLAELVFRDALGLDPDRLEGHLDFVKSVHDAVVELEAGDYGMAAFLGATPMDEVRTVAERGETMPQKSTYFYPKLLTGLVFNAL